MKRPKDEIESGDLFNKKSKQTPIMDQIVNTPGLQHIIEIIFFNLDFKDLMNCQLVNKSVNIILENAMFWLKKWRFNRGLSKINQNNWIKALQMTENTNLEKNVALYIKKVIKIGYFVDVPCYIDNDTVINANRISFEEALRQKNAGILQILAAITRNFNAPRATDLQDTPILNASEMGNLDVIKSLAPLIENPNSPPDKEGFTPIHLAVLNENSDIVRFLAPLTENPITTFPYEPHAQPMNQLALDGNLDLIRFLAPMTVNPNASDMNGQTPIYLAALKKDIEMVRFLAPLTDNPNAPDENGITPIHLAAEKNDLEIVKFLAPLTENPNAPDDDGETPIDVANDGGHNEIVQFLQSYIKK